MKRLYIGNTLCGSYDYDLIYKMCISQEAMRQSQVRFHISISRIVKTINVTLCMSNISFYVSIKLHQLNHLVYLLVLKVTEFVLLNFIEKILNLQDIFEFRFKFFWPYRYSHV